MEMRHARTVLTVQLAGLVAYGCGEGAVTTPSAPTGAAQSAEAIPAAIQGLPTQDERWAHASRTDAPGFAGVFIGVDGQLVVSIATPGSEAASAAFVRSANNPHASRPIRYRQVEFSFAQLSDWRDQIAAIVGPAAVTLDVDEVGNTVTIGVATEEAVALERQRILQAEIPERAVRFKVVGPGPYDRLSLSQHGGIGGTRFFYLDQQGGQHNCTVGVAGDWNGKEVWVTASHCSWNTFQLDGNGAATSFNGSSVHAGVEVHDPTYGEVGFNCWVGLNPPSLMPCRASDAALYEWQPNFPEVQPYRIAQTEHSNACLPTCPPTYPWGSREIFGANPHWVVADAVTGFSEIWVGQDVSKVGDRSGWTEGSILQCIDGEDQSGQSTQCNPWPFPNSTCFNFTNGSKRLYCQFEAALVSDVGDSGAPVFTFDTPYTGPPDGGDPVKLLGILWGGPAYSLTGECTSGHVTCDGGADENENITWFSPWNGVVEDLGFVKVCLPVFGNPAC